MKEQTICSAGIVYLYLLGNIEKENMCVHSVNSYIFPQERFCEKVREIRATYAGSASTEAFCILGVHDKIDVIAKSITDEIQDSFGCVAEGKKLRFVGKNLDGSGKMFSRLFRDFIISEDLARYPRTWRLDHGRWGIHCFWGGNDPTDAGHEYVNEILKVWLSCEQPTLFGKQLMIQTFLLRDLAGRKILGVLPSNDTGDWTLLLEGGLKLRLNDSLPYSREKIEVDRFSVANIDTILLNPIYSYGIAYEPIELCEEWHKAFFLAAALSDAVWEEKNIVSVYNKLLRFLERNICTVIQAESILDKNLYFRTVLLTIQRIRRFLRGEEEVVISKDLLMLMNSRYIYLPYIVELIQKQLPNAVTYDREPTVFQASVLQDYIAQSERGTVNQRGCLWENAAEYVMGHIKGLRVSGKRVRAGTQEIDLSVVNTSCDAKLWELGAYILVECKNWTKKVGVPVIRNLGHICNIKGNKTAVLIVASELTADAQREVERLAQNGIYILYITKKDMLNLQSEQACYDLLMMKWETHPGPKEGIAF